LQLIPRLEFESAVRKHGAERHARGFSSWGQFIAMLFCQLGHAKSLREICGGLAASEGKLRHLGLPAAPARSTLAYANEHRPWQLCRTVFDQLLAKCQTLAASQLGTRKKKKFRFKNPLVYKERWQIELFFRALKQSLRVKTFVGTSAQALKTQLWTALIAILLVKYLQ
jgi:transposase